MKHPVVFDILFQVAHVTTRPKELQNHRSKLERLWMTLCCKSYKIPLIQSLLILCSFPKILHSPTIGGDVVLAYMTYLEVSTCCLLKITLNPNNPIVYNRKV